MTGLWITISLVLFIACCISIFYVIKFGIIIVRIQDVVEESLDVLDDGYTSMDKILKTPLFYDSHEVKQVLNDIKVCRESIVQIAIALTNIDSDEYKRPL